MSNIRNRLRCLLAGSDRRENSSRTVRSLLGDENGFVAVTAALTLPILLFVCLAVLEIGLTLARVQVSTATLKSLCEQAVTSNYNSSDPAYRFTASARTSLLTTLLAADPHDGVHITGRIVTIERNPTTGKQYFSGAIDITRSVRYYTMEIFGVTSATTTRTISCNGLPDLNELIFESPNSPIRNQVWAVPRGNLQGSLRRSSLAALRSSTCIVTYRGLGVKVRISSSDVPHRKTIDFSDATPAQSVSGNPINGMFMYNSGCGNKATVAKVWLTPGEYRFTFQYQPVIPQIYVSQSQPNFPGPAVGDYNAFSFDLQNSSCRSTSCSSIVTFSGGAPTISEDTSSLDPRQVHHWVRYDSTFTLNDFVKANVVFFPSRAIDGYVSEGSDMVSVPSFTMPFTDLALVRTGD